MRTWLFGVFALLVWSLLPSQGGDVWVPLAFAGLVLCVYADVRDDRSGL